MAYALRTGMKMRLGDVKLGEQHKIYDIHESVSTIELSWRARDADPYRGDHGEQLHGNWHTDPELSARHIFGAPVNYGVQTCGYIASGLLETFGPEILPGGYKTYVKLANPVRAGDTLSVFATAVDLQEAPSGLSATFDVLVETQEEKVVAAARVRVREGDIDIFAEPLEPLPEVERPERTERDDDTEGVFEYEDAVVGDKAPPFVYMVTREGIARYSEGIRSFNALCHEVDYARGQGFPDVVGHPMYGLAVAPHRRNDIMKKNGLETPHNHPTNPHATPFARLDYTLYRPLMPGELLTSTGRIADKYIRRGRKYIGWGATAQDERGEVVVDYIYTCFWGRGKASDRTR